LRSSNARFLLLPGSQRSTAVVLNSKELDYSGGVFRSGHPAADPSCLGQDVVGLGATSCDHLVANLARQGQVGQAVAVNVAHLSAAIPVFGAAEAVRYRFDSRPRGDSLPDPLTSSLHIYQ